MCAYTICIDTYRGQARKYACAAQWARVLTDEFANQGAMEKELNLPTCLFGGPPDPNDFLKLAESQLGFMNIFARPLFEGVTVILPEMKFTLAELSTNKSIWQERMEAENSRKMSFARSQVSVDVKSHLTPRTADNSSRAGSGSAQGGRDRQKSNPSIVMSSTDDTPATTYDPSRSGSFADPPSRMKPSSPSAFVNHGSPKDVSSPDNLEVNDLDARRHSSVYSRKEDEFAAPSRAASSDPAGPASFMSEPSPAARDILSYSQPPSPVKSAASAVSRSQPDRSVPSTTSQATSAGDGGPVSPSTRASSVEDSSVTADMRKAPPTAVTENPFMHSNRSEDFSFLKTDPNLDLSPRKPQTMSVYGADILAIAAANSPGKSSATSQITSGTSEYFGDDRHDLRTSRSQSRLRGLRFWKKKPFDQTP